MTRLRCAPVARYVLPDMRCWLYLILLPVFVVLYSKLVVPRYKHKATRPPGAHKHAGPFHVLRLTMKLSDSYI